MVYLKELAFSKQNKIYINGQFTQTFYSWGYLKPVTFLSLSCHIYIFIPTMYGDIIGKTHHTPTHTHTTEQNFYT